MADLNLIFEAIVRNLERRRDHVAHVLSGPRCEQWLNPESRAAVNSQLRSGSEFVNAEIVYDKQRPDLEVCQANTAGDGVIIHQVGEGKVVWNEANSDILPSLNDLKIQMNANKVRAASADSLGILYAVWHAKYAGSRGNEDEAAYIDRLEKLISQNFDVTQYDRPVGGFRTVFSKAVTPIGPFGTTLTLGVTLLRRRDESAAEQAARLDAATAAEKRKLGEAAAAAAIRIKNPRPTTPATVRRKQNDEL